MPAATRRKAQPRKPKTVRAQDVADWLRDRIRRGRFAPGQRLVEADIVDQVGASRGKVREALQRLEAEGLVAIEAFRGASVRRIGPDEVRQIYRTRMALEGLAAAEFAAADAPKLKERLRVLQDQMDHWREHGGHERFAELNGQWHRLIVEGSGNAYLGEFLSRLTVPIYRLFFSSFYTEQRVDDANADHKKITAAIVAGDAEEAEAQMRRHISDGLAGVSEIIERFVD